MRIIIKELILMMIILLFQATFLHDLGYSQSHEKKQSLNNDVVPDEVVERLRGIYEKGLFSARSFRAKWNPDGSGYLVLENLPGNDEQALVSYEVESGNRSVLITSSQLDLPGKTGRLLIESYVFSSDGMRILLKAGHEDRGDTNPGYWMLETKTGAIQSVTAGNNSRISPEGQRLLYADQGNLYVSDVTRDQTTQLTRDAMEGKVWNGRAVWSPSGKRIAYIQTDASDVKVRSSLVPGDPSYPEIRETRFARAGGTINSLRLAVIDSEGKEQRWLPIPIPAEGFYLGQVSWAGNSNELLVERLSRFGDKREFFLVDVNSGKATIIYEESDPAWVVASYRKNSGLSWIRDFSAFIVLSEKDGWRHAYVCSRDGQSQDLLTPGEFDIIERVKVDEEKGWFYYNASPDNGTQKYLYRVKLKGNGKAERVTPMDQPGTHNYAVSPDAKWAFHTYSSRDTPHITELVKLPEHKVVRVLEDNKVLRNRMDSLQVQAKEWRAPCTDGAGCLGTCHD
jgi:dipeptidyl-peptidase-4